MPVFFLNFCWSNLRLTWLAGVLYLCRQELTGMKLNWINLENQEQLDELNKRSASKLQVIFKHSTRCSISAVAKNRLEKEKAPENVEFYYLDLLRFRPVSDAIAVDFGVRHESPQILAIRDGKVVYHESHLGIRMSDVFPLLD